MKIKLLFKDMGVIILANLLMGCASQVAQPGNAAAQGTESSLSSEQTKQATALNSRKDEEYMYKILVAEIAGQRGHYTLSAEYFFDIAEQTQDVYLAERATRVALYAKEVLLATKAGQLWVELAPADLDARRILGSLLLRQKRINEALAQLEALLKNTQDPDRYIEAIVTFLGPQKEQASALELIEKLIDKRPHDPPTLLFYAHLLIHVEQFDRALEVLQQLLDLVPDHGQAVPLYGHVLAEQNKLEEALQWMAQVLKKSPEQQAWRLAYARMLANAEEFEQAIDQFKLLLPHYSEKSDILYALGILNLQTEQLQAAKTYFMKLLKIGQRFNDAYYYLGQIAERENTAKTALAWYKKVDGGNNYLNAIARVVLILIDQKDLIKALDYLHKVEVDEEDLLILIQFEAELLVEHKRYTQAMAIYNHALEDYQDNTELLYMRALLAEKIGDMKQLEQDLQRILLLEPNNVQALNALGYSLADNNTDRLDEAYDLIQRALILRPEDYYILDSMGWVLYRMGHHEEAIEYLRKAQAKQDDPEVAAHLGEVLWVSGDKQAAQLIWEQARTRFPEDEQLQEVMQRFLP